MSKVQNAIDALDGCDEYSLRHHMSEISILIEGYAEAQAELATMRQDLVTANKDAEHYRWLRDHGDASWESWFQELRDGVMTPDQADSSVDEWSATTNSRS